MRIGVFGGTFNPVHYGHLRAAEEALHGLDLEKVLFVPAGNPPLKSEGLASTEDRLAMVESAIAGNPRFELSLVEASKADKSYSVSTLSVLCSQYPEATLVFILGIDAFCEIHLWKDPGELLSLADFAVLSRPGYLFAPVAEFPYADIQVEQLSALDSGRTRKATGTLKGGRRLELMRITPMGVSATMIRELVAAGESLMYLLPESVESFIMSNRLYSGN